MKLTSESDMLALGAQFAQSLQRARTHATILELIGDVGTGKTTFTRGLAQGLGVKETLSSPSFTISRTYALPDGGQLIHYDFYRLPDPGLMADDLVEALADPANLVVIEWGESVQDLLPPARHVIHFAYHDDGSHLVTIASPDSKSVASRNHATAKSSAGEHSAVAAKTSPEARI